MAVIHLEARNISKSFAKHQALNGVSISVPKQSVFGLLGPNGAGKTTLIRIINQILGPDGGQVLLDGRPLVRDDISRIGYMPEERGLYRKMKVGEQITYFARLKGLDKQQVRKAMDYWFGVFDINAWRDKKVEELSKGMQQKVQFIVTVIHNPELLILDEPFSGFDPKNAEIIKEEILKLRNQGTTIILSTHRMESVEALCDNIALIHKAKVVVDGPVREVRHRFKQNMFELQLESSNGQPQIQWPGVELTDVQELANNQWHYFLQAGQETDTNRILQSAMAQGRVVLFREILPSINDIFIQLVSDTTHE